MSRVVKTGPRWFVCRYCERLLPCRGYGQEVCNRRICQGKRAAANRRAWRRRHTWRRYWIICDNPDCGVRIERTHSRQRYCSRGCRLEVERTRDIERRAKSRKESPDAEA